MASSSSNLFPQFSVRGEVPEVVLHVQQRRCKRVAVGRTVGAGGMVKSGWGEGARVRRCSSTPLIGSGVSGKEESWELADILLMAAGLKLARWRYVPAELKGGPAPGTRGEVGAQLGAAGDSRSRWILSSRWRRLGLSPARPVLRAWSRDSGVEACAGAKKRGGGRATESTQAREGRQWMRSTRARGHGVATLCRGGSRAARPRTLYQRVARRGQELEAWRRSRWWWATTRWPWKG